MKKDDYRTGIIVPVQDDPGRLEAYLPSQNVQNHASNLLYLENGDLLCCWFSGTQEGLSDISIYLSRLQKDAKQWAKPEKISHDAERSEQNPVLFSPEKGTIWLFWTSQKGGNQDSAVVMRRISGDNGTTWGEVELFLDQPGTFVRQPIVVAGNGDWLLPIFYCVSVPGKKWVGDRDYSAVKISSDRGKTWRETVVPESTCCVHMNIVKHPDGTLSAFFRSRRADRIYMSESNDNGQTWSSATPTDLANNNSSIQLTALDNGHLVMVFNNVNGDNITERRASLYDDIEKEGDNGSGIKEPEVEISTAAVWGVPRAPLTLAISMDKGRSWPLLRDLEVGDGYCMTNNSRDALNREYSYPAIIQTPNGSLHISYTYFRQTIKYVCIEEKWMGAGAA